MYHTPANAESVQVKRMKARIAEIDAAHDVESERLGAILAAAHSKLSSKPGLRG